MDLVDEQRRVEHEHEAEPDERDLRREAEEREQDVEVRRLAEAADVQCREDRDHAARRR